MATRKAIAAAERLLTNYRPRDQEARELLAARHDEMFEALGCIPLTTRNYARTALGFMLRYALFLETIGAWTRESDVPVPFAHRYVSLYTERRAADGHHGAQTAQSMLSKIGRVYQPHLWPRTTAPTRARNPDAPYSADEQDELRTVASQFRAVRGDARLEATIGGVLGAGLSPADLRVVRGHHVTRDTDGTVFVHVVGSTLPDRTIAVLPEWADYVYDAARHMGDQLLISGTTDDTRNHSQRITVPLNKFAGLHISLNRLRATWMIGRLAAGVPDRLVREFAGLQDSAQFSTFDVHYDDWDDDTKHRWLRNGGRPC